MQNNKHCLPVYSLFISLGNNLLTHSVKQMPERIIITTKGLAIIRYACLHMRNLVLTKTLDLRVIKENPN